MTRPQAASPRAGPDPPSRCGGDRPSAGSAILPQVLGDYRLDHELGRGGAGIVYAAEQISTGRRVALKLPLNADAPDEDAVARFRREGLAAGSIDHPHCVFVFDADECEGQPYIAMERMEGGNLRELVERVGPLEPARAVHLILQVLDGLEAAARRGVLHRDVKPSNCFLDVDGSVKVGDFGICRALEGPSDLTRTSNVLGTPLYVAPEQVRGLPLDERSDQYSLGATLFFLLTGRPPVLGGRIGVVLARILRGETLRVRELQPGIPRGLDRIVARSLSLDRRRRFASYAALRRALLAYAPRASVPIRLSRRAVAASVDALVIGALTWPAWELGPSWLLPLVGIGYLTATESLLGATVGQGLAALRVVTTRGLPPSLGRLLLRNVVMAGVGTAAVAGATISLPGSEALALLMAFALIGLPTVRRRDRAALHELASGTRTSGRPSDPIAVVRKDRHGRERSFRLRPSKSSEERIGAFEIMGRLSEGRAGTLLLAEDRQLRRVAWVLTRPPGSAPPTAARRAVRRVTRLRWLSGGDAAGGRWDAYAPPSGSPWIDAVGTAGPWTWPRACGPLLSLACELREAEADGSLPVNPSLDEVWLDEATGGACLADFGSADPDSARAGSFGSLSLRAEAQPEGPGTIPASRRSARAGACRVLAAAARSMVGRAVPEDAAGLLDALAAGAPPPGGLAEVVSRLLLWRAP